ncbi:trypsin iota-like [Drosophila bipectinata]|uniref:trypsin iota-like n=1 Tax=Drosophila bipectinata TaxID=42026 RepID=UPI0038B2BFBE
MLRITWILVLAILPWSSHGKPPESCGIMGDPIGIPQAAWHASIEVHGKAKCGGALLKPKYVLTAASCVKKILVSHIRVRLGTAVRNAGGSLLGVCKVIVHEQFSSKVYDSNLALLQLCEPAPSSDKINPISVLRKQPKTGEKITASGWGSISWWGRLSSSCWATASVVLRKATLPLQNLTICKAKRKGFLQYFRKAVTDLNICTTKSDKLCSYDLGSPLVSNDHLVGILSKGDCSNKPEVYSSLVNHNTWLDLNTKE